MFEFHSQAQKKYAEKFGFNLWISTPKISHI